MFQIANIERHRTSVTKTRGLLDLKSTSKGMFIILKNDLVNSRGGFRDSTSEISAFKAKSEF